MLESMGIVLLVIYGISMSYIFLFSLVQLHLALFYRKPASGSNVPVREEPRKEWPTVTVQLPVYNEKYVVERLIDCIVGFDYPKEKMEIQVLDDSTDETSKLIEEKVASYREHGYKISHVKRAGREGFKAGALQFGLELAKGDYIAIFDADFLPAADFLKKTIPHFENETTGMVQTRWGHLNKDFSLITRLQAFGLNGHFSVEQGGRSNAGSFINFNGTAGVWRKRCIVEAGGWQADTLTEDLDLSYRAQMRGWKFKFLEDVESPAELPVLMSALKTQQYRWNKGGAETARKNLLQMFRSPLGFRSKIHAFFHLTGSANFLFLLVISLLSAPLLYLRQSHPEWGHLLQFSAVFVLGFMAISFFYWTATVSRYSSAIKNYLVHYPLFMMFSMGMALHNGLAVLEGILGIKTPFLRTPKFNVVGVSGSWKRNAYVVDSISFVTILEGILCLYFLFGTLMSFLLHDYGLVLFHIMLSVGYGGVFYYSIKR